MTTKSDRKVLKDSAAYMEDQARRIRARPEITAAAKKHLRKMDYLAARLRALLGRASPGAGA